jgi:hypothetical protein
LLKKYTILPDMMADLELEIINIKENAWPNPTNQQAAF